MATATDAPISFHTAARTPSLTVIGLAGPSGSGKSFSALRLARGLAGKDPFYVIDTENGKSEQLYGDRFGPWACGVFDAPFTPERYAAAISAALEHTPSVIVIDSISDEHDGEGGLLDIQEAYIEQKSGGDARRREALNFAGWRVAKERHKRLVRELRVPRCHLIVCMRAQDKIELIKKDGKLTAVPKRSLIGVEGWEPICEKRLPYELFASFLVLPDRPGVPRPIKLPEPYRPLVPLDKQLSEETGVALREWAKGKDDPGDEKIEAVTRELLDHAEKLGQRAKVIANVQANRQLHAAERPKHLAWLRRQLRAAKAAAAKAAADADGDVRFEEVGS